MFDPFKIDSKTCISFSGGRTSAYMLWRVLQSHGGKLPAETIVCFANTGKEDEATLRFVRDCGVHWNVPIVWLEYRNDERGYTVVDFDTASRNGEPFEAIIRKRNYLPNPVTRFCTVELKIRVMAKFLKLSGMLENELEMMIGIRADEQRRVIKMRNSKHSESSKISNQVPLADAGITVHDINEFWNKQPFNLELVTHNGRTLEGNCDLCFLKPLSQIVSLSTAKPIRPIWWARMEALALASKPDGARFRKDRPGYAEIAKFSQDQMDMFDHDEEGISCFCGD